MRRSLFRPVALGACLALPLLLAACASESVPQSFPPLRYNYLAPLSLDVGAIQTRVRYAPAQDGSSLDAMSPESPLQAVEQMIQDRLVAGGTGGTATVNINAASINQVNDTAVGNISIHLTVTSADGRNRGFTDASVTRSRTMPDTTDPDAIRAFLYAMTQDLVNAENVELEYQIRHNLASWLVGGGSAVIGGPAAPMPVQATPLGGPGAPTPMTGAALPDGAAAEVPAGTDSSMPGSSLGLPMGNPVPTGQNLSAPAPIAAPTTSAMPGAPMATPAAAPGAPIPLTPAMPASTTPPSGTLGTMPVSPTPTPAPTVATPPPAPTTAPVSTPKQAPSSSSSALPPLPAGITP